MGRMHNPHPGAALQEGLAEALRLADLLGATVQR